MTTVDRRHEPRVQAFNLVNAAEYDVFGGLEDLALGRTSDLSHDGVRLELNHCLPLRSTVSISLALGNTIVELRGRVVSVSEVDSRTCGMGIEFSDVTPEQYEQLEEYLQLRA